MPGLAYIPLRPLSSLDLILRRLVKNLFSLDLGPKACRVSRATNTAFLILDIATVRARFLRGYHGQSVDFIWWAEGPFPRLLWDLIWEKIHVEILSFLRALRQR